MPDISMCYGEGCEKKDERYRYKAKPTPHWQSYFVTPPIKDGQCEHFWSTSSMPDETIRVKVPRRRKPKTT